MLVFSDRYSLPVISSGVEWKSHRVLFWCGRKLTDSDCQQWWSESLNKNRLKTVFKSFDLLLKLDCSTKKQPDNHIYRQPKPRFQVGKTSSFSGTMQISNWVELNGVLQRQRRCAGTDEAGRRVWLDTADDGRHTPLRQDGVKHGISAIAADRGHRRVTETRCQWQWCRWCCHVVSSACRTQSWRTNTSTLQPGIYNTHTHTHTPV